MFLRKISPRHPCDTYKKLYEATLNELRYAGLFHLEKLAKLIALLETITLPYVNLLSVLVLLKAMKTYRKTGEFTFRGKPFFYKKEEWERK